MKPIEHVKIVEHPLYFESDGLYEVKIETPLLLDRGEIKKLAEFLYHVACDDVSAEVFGWLDENPPEECRLFGSEEEES